MKKVIHTDHAPAPIGPYSQAIEAGPFVFCSGQIPINPATGDVLTGAVEEQAQQVMKNIAALLKAANVGFENIVKTTIYLTDMNDFAKVNAVYGEYFKNNAPARTTIAVAGLPKNVKVEIEVIAQHS